MITSGQSSTTPPLPSSSGRPASDHGGHRLYRRGAALGRSLADALGGSLHVPARFAPEVGAEAYASLEGWTAWAWARADALVFVCTARAAGIALGRAPMWEVSGRGQCGRGGAVCGSPPLRPRGGRQRAGAEGGRPHRRAGGGIHRHRCQRPVRRGRVGPGAGHGHHGPGFTQPRGYPPPCWRGRWAASDFITPMPGSLT